jgi:hypothetical protein
MYLWRPSKSKRSCVRSNIPEMMTIIILFHQSNYRTFKHFYFYVFSHLKSAFPKLISYNCFVYLMKNLFVPLFAYLLHRKGIVTGIAFIDSTSVAVCHNKRIQRNKVFKGLAKRGKTTAGWFFGFKLHLIINDTDEISSFSIDPVRRFNGRYSFSGDFLESFSAIKDIFQQNWPNLFYNVVWSYLRAYAPFSRLL